MHVKLAGMKLLLAEDDTILADALSANLRQAGYEVNIAPNGAVAEYLLLNQPFDLGILDIGLPMLDGLSVLKRVRSAKSQMPILILTALDGLDDRVAGLNAGADDYLTKPFDFPELEARLRALLRRSRTPADHPNPESTMPMQTFAKLVFDRDARRAYVDEQMMELSPREWQLLDLFLSHADRVVSKDQIAQSWEVDSSESGLSSLEVYIHRLRRKIEGSGLTIRTVRGLGYLLEQET